VCEGTLTFVMRPREEGALGSSRWLVLLESLLGSRWRLQEKEGGRERGEKTVSLPPTPGWAPLQIFRRREAREGSQVTGPPLACVRVFRECFGVWMWVAFVIIVSSGPAPLPCVAPAHVLPFAFLVSPQILLSSHFFLTSSHSSSSS
jgi:hypothetical protein